MQPPQIENTADSSHPSPSAPTPPPFPTLEILTFESLRTTLLLKEDLFYQEVLKGDLKLLHQFWSLFPLLFAEGLDSADGATGLTTSSIHVMKSSLGTVLKSIRPSLILSYDESHRKRYEDLFLVHLQILEKIYGDLDIRDLEYSVGLFARPWQLNIVVVMKTALQKLRQELIAREVEWNAWAPTYSIELFGTLHSGYGKCFRLWSRLVEKVDNDEYNSYENSRPAKKGLLKYWVANSTSLSSGPFERVTHPLFPGRIIFNLNKDGIYDLPPTYDSQDVLRKLSASVKLSSGSGARAPLAQLVVPETDDWAV